MDIAELRRQAAESPVGSIDRTLWIVALVNSVIDEEAILIGGSAQNLYTGEYRPTDIDLAIPGVRGQLVEQLSAAGFADPGVGHRHVELHLNEDEPPVLVEIPTSGSDIERTTSIVLADDVEVQVISLEDLLVDRLIQATNGSLVTFEDALALAVATFERVDWSTVKDTVAVRSQEPLLGELPTVLTRVRAAAQEALAR